MEQATADEVMALLHGNASTIAQRKDNKVILNKPGYKTSHGITFDEQGRAIYVNEDWTPAATGSGGTFLIKYKISSARTITSGATSVVNFDTLQLDDAPLVTTGGSWSFPAPASTWYTIHVNAQIAPDGAGGDKWTDGDYCAFEIWHNGSGDGTTDGTIAAYTQINTQASLAGSIRTIKLNGSVDYYLASGDTLQIRFENGTGGDLIIASGASLSITQWGGATGGGGAGAIGAQGGWHLTGASFTLTLTNGSDVIVDYNIADSDPYSQFSGNTFTAGVAMTVDVTAALASTGETWAGGDSWTLYVKKNNTTNVGTIDSHSGAAAGDVSLSGTATGIVLAPGDFIEVFIATTHAAGDVSVSTAGSPSMSIDRTA